MHDNLKLFSYERDGLWHVGMVNSFVHATGKDKDTAFYEFFKKFTSELKPVRQLQVVSRMEAEVAHG